MENWLEDKDLVILNDGRPTRLVCPPASNSAIDLSLVRDSHALDCYWDPLEQSLGSDHMPIVINWRFSGGNMDEGPEPGESYSDIRIEWPKFSAQVGAQITCVNDPNPLIRLEKFNEILLKAAVDSQKKRSSGRNRGNRRGSHEQDQIWFDAECVKAWDDRLESFRIYRRTGTRADFLAYLRKDDWTKQLFDKKRQESWRGTCESFSSTTSLGKLWNMARAYRGKSRTRNVVLDNDELNAFADKLAPPFANRPFTLDVEVAVDVNVNSEFWSDLSLDELGYAMENMKNKAAGCDQIKLSLLKRLPLLWPGLTDCTVYDRVFMDETTWQPD
ncbi:hypothetical protein DMENIID0001_041650 [Sergentomyia squamirostris]